MSETKSDHHSPEGESHADHAHSEHFQSYIRKCIGVFVALLVLTVVTVGASYIHLGTAGNITLAMIIASFKAALVAAIFMHLSAEKSLVFRVLVFTVIFFGGLMFLTLGAYHDLVELFVP